MKASRLSYVERSHYCLSSIAKNLLQLLDEKKTNLALSADVTSAQQLLDLAYELGPEICILKTHIDIIKDFTPNLTQQLRKIAHKYRFFIFEDRKFADIGNTVKQQYEGGIYHIAEWADFVNAHSLPGPGILQGLAQVGRKKNRGMILLAEMSSEGHLMNQEYIKNTLKMAEQYADFVIGFITQQVISSDPHWINFTPGVKLEESTDALGQIYVTPEKAVLQNGSDVVIVGRGIFTAKNPLAKAQEYRERSWNAYLKRIDSSIGKTYTG